MKSDLSAYLSLAALTVCCLNDISCRRHNASQSVSQPASQPHKTADGAHTEQQQKCTKELNWLNKDKSLQIKMLQIESEILKVWIKGQDMRLSPVILEWRRSYKQHMRGNWSGKRKQGSPQQEGPKVVQIQKSGKLQGEGLTFKSSLMTSWKQNSVFVLDGSQNIQTLFFFKSLNLFWCFFCLKQLIMWLDACSVRKSRPVFGSGLLSATFQFPPVQTPGEVKS